MPPWSTLVEGGKERYWPLGKSTSEVVHTKLKQSPLTSWLNGLIKLFISFYKSAPLHCGQYYKYFTLVIYDSRVAVTRNYLQYASRVVNYQRKVFIRLTNGWCIICPNNLIIFKLGKRFYNIGPSKHIERGIFQDVSDYFS